MTLNYTELCRLDSFEDRFEYLKLPGEVGIATFGFDRYLNQTFYTSSTWRRVRRDVLIRDNGFDLGCDDRPVNGKALVHHMNPIREEDIVHRNPDILNPEYLITVSHTTHNAIHYGLDVRPQPVFVNRRAGDTKLW